ncbi:hypothetical protein NXC12_PD00028 (plasmid) [Rhizobium etli]|uniref:Uncharacterized protein n=1 Tax=Rhizobium etli TaxID=29449 RepID=A0AAN1BMC5_RHIET|nr:hypothetical protein [Rhizobium etli]ARQ13141.1 hypothetical protein NXC12_PD00028 [Rhizobium etli]
MILSHEFQTQTVLNDAEVALCQRVFDQVVSVRKITSDPQRQDLACRIIRSYQHGVKDEDGLLRLLIERS